MSSSSTRPHWADKAAGSSLPPPVVQPSSRGSNNCLSKWLRFGTRRTQPTTEASKSPMSSAVDCEKNCGCPLDADDGFVNEVVVDRSWSQLGTPDSRSISDDECSVRDLPQRQSPAPSFENLHKLPWAARPFSSVLWCRVRSGMTELFSSRFSDAQKECDYLKECWEQSKTPALWSSGFLIVNWALASGFISRRTMADTIYDFCVAPVLTFPILIMNAYNFPRDHSTFYQVFLCVSIWIWPSYKILYMRLCGFNTRFQGLFPCGERDFLSTFYYSTALQTIALFGACLKRFPALISSMMFLIYYCSMLFPANRANWIRHTLDFVVYQGFLLYIHYRRENAFRRLYALKMQLNIQFKRTQEAQINEREAADSKRRLTSYVRVPLNTALLAVQNMKASRIDKNQALEFNALEGSLGMMSKVLNDILDFNRMDSGRLECLSHPYAFHQVMQSLFIPLQLATNARGLELVTNLDLDIDNVSRRAEYKFLGMSDQAIEQRLRDDRSGEPVYGMVVGDETRLRQIVTNLASNACKFTPSGGKVTITTCLVLPQMTNSPSALSSVQSIVVRIEVSDTGWGIRPQDMANCKLFSAFNQTQQGRLQGGKGTGLGLALVRQIVKLSGGRLGVQSKLGEGSTFWVELPLGVGCRTAVPSLPPVPGTTSVSVMQILDDALPVSQNIHSSTDRLKSIKSPVESLSPRTRSGSVHHNIMEQGGKVELILQRRNSSPPRFSCKPGELSVGYHDVIPLFEKPGATDEDGPSGTTKPFGLELIKQEYSDTDTEITTPRPPHQLPPSIIQPGPRSVPHDRLEVLVVDDDLLTRTLMKRMLTRMGYTVTTAENGREAIRLITGSTAPENGPANGGKDFAIVFMDNQMPVLSGLKAVGQLRALGRKDFIVGVTGNALLEDQKEYMKAGVDYVLTKPVLERSLRGMLALALERRRSCSLADGT